MPSAALQRVAVGHRQHRVARRHEQRAQLALAGRLDLARQQRRGQVAEHVGEVAEARAHLAVGGEPEPLADVVERDRRPAEDGAAGAVEVAGDRVERVDQEGDERAEAAEARAGAPVGGRAVGVRRSRARARAIVVGRDARARSATASGVCGRASVAQRVGAVGVLRRGSRWSARPSSKITCSIASSSHASVSGRDRHVLELARGLGAARVDDDDAAAARHDRRAAARGCAAR